MPSSAGTIESMVLHTLLLHGGAPANLLEALLPYDRIDIRWALSQLLESKLVKKAAGDIWHVTLLGYPAVRQHMEDEGYLVDPF